MPGTATGTVFLNSRNEAAATCSGRACCGAFLPGTAILGFSTMPSSKMRCS